MAPRTILYTGKGGVGKTSVAAATALRCAARGQRTLILSTDPAHSLSASLQTELAAEPTAVRERLQAAEIDTQHELAKRWAGVRAWLESVLVERGVERISALELTVPPGMDELFALLALREHHASGDFDVIVVDCAPTGETLRMLSFPDAARWWLERVVPLQRMILAAAAPFARNVLEVPLPTDAVLEDVNRLSEQMIAMDTILRDHDHTSVRLVMAPDRMVIGETMQTFTHLNLYGYLTDAVIVNKVFPPGVGDYFARWRELQGEQLTLVRDAFSPIPLLEVPYFAQEAIGPEMLERLGDELFGAGPLTGASPNASPATDPGPHAPPTPAPSVDPAASVAPAASVDPAPSVDPAAILHQSVIQAIESSPTGAVLRLTIPFVSKADIALKQVGPELVVSAGRHRRVVMLPATLSAYKAVSASYEDGTLEVSFDRG